MTTMAPTLTEFLTARLDEDASVATGLAPSPWGNLNVAAHARILAEVEAKRRIVDRATYMGEAEDRMGGYADEFLSLLALPYADHPDYRQEWRA